MAFKMKGSPMKLGKIQGTVGHVSALKQKEDSEKVREAYYQEELKKLQADPDIGDPDPKQDEKDARKAAEEKYYKEKTKSPAEKSALKQVKHQEIKDRLKGEDLTEDERLAILAKLKAEYEKEEESKEKAPKGMTKTIGNIERETP